MATARPTATPKQIAFAESLITECSALDPDFDAESWSSSIAAAGKRGASNLIDSLIDHRNRARQRAARAAGVAPQGDVPEGVHMNDAGQYVKVQQSQHGNLYGKVAHLHPAPSDDPFVRVDWEYGGKRALDGLTADTLLDAEQAAAFGHLTGRCVFCTTALSDERSVSVGYGPTCADRHGLPWGDVTEVVRTAHETVAA